MLDSAMRRLVDPLLNRPGTPSSRRRLARMRKNSLTNVLGYASLAGSRPPEGRESRGVVTWDGTGAAPGNACPGPGVARGTRGAWPGRVLRARHSPRPAGQSLAPALAQDTVRGTPIGSRIN